MHNSLRVTVYVLTVLCLIVSCFVEGLSDNKIIKRNISDNTFDNSYYPALNWSDEVDWNLFKAVDELEINAIISPLSLKIALAVIYEGASGATESELLSVLNFESKEAARSKYSKIIQDLQTPDGFSDIRIATGLFLDTNIIPRQKYSSNIKASYNTEVEPTNFVTPEQASHKINTWLRKETNNLIDEIVKPDDLEDIVLLVANAVFFKGLWEYAFPKNATTIGSFHTTPTSLVTVEYMKTIRTLYYTESRELDAQILRIPYKGDKFGFFIILPNSKGGLQRLISTITLSKLKRNMFNLDEVVVDVILPKFKFEYTCAFSPILQELGLRQMFSPTASLTEIARGFGYGYKRLLVNDIRQKSGIEVNEDGSIIVSTTEVLVGNKFGDVDFIFNASHPFMFFVEHQATGSILFIGKVENPLLKEPIATPVRFSEKAEAAPVALSASFDAGAPVQLAPVAPPDNTIQSRFNYFDLELLKTFGGDSNYLISPASIKTTLGMLLEGARGKGAQQIGELLRIPVSQEGIRDKLHKLLYDLNDKSGSTIIEAANALFVANSLTVSPSYREVLGNVYRAMVTPLNYSNSAESVATINKWVSDATKGQIPKLIDSDHLDPYTTAVIANALYFKGKWKEAFNVKNTNERKCFKVKGSCVYTPMMHLVGTFNYKFIDELDASAVELPYSDGKYAMLILLPSVKSNVDGLIRDLQHISFAFIINSLEQSEVLVEIPRFEVDYSTDMVPVLRALGIRDVFGSNANLTGIVEDGNIKVDSVLHKAKIEVNEEGTVASAATGAVVVPLMGSVIQEVIADRPFLFFIYHVESKNIIFEGRFNQPQNTVQQLVRQVYPIPERGEKLRLSVKSNVSPSRGNGVVFWN